MLLALNLVFFAGKCLNFLTGSLKFRGEGHDATDAAPLYFRTLWRYRNCIIIIILIWFRICIQSPWILGTFFYELSDETFRWVGRGPRNNNCWIRRIR